MVLCAAQAVTALGLTTIDVEGAGQKDTQAGQGIVSKKAVAATPVPKETILVPVGTPAATVPAVAVSGTAV